VRDRVSEMRDRGFQPLLISVLSHLPRIYDTTLILLCYFCAATQIVGAHYHAPYMLGRERLRSFAQQCAATFQVAAQK
jgi:hypothetical protein